MGLAEIINTANRLIQAPSKYLEVTYYFLEEQRGKDKTLNHKKVRDLILKVIHPFYPVLPLIGMKNPLISVVVYLLQSSKMTLF